MNFIRQSVFAIFFSLFSLITCIASLKIKRCRRPASPFHLPPSSALPDICYPFDSPLSIDPSPFHDDLDFFEFIAQKSGEHIATTTPKAKDPISSTPAPSVITEKPVIEIVRGEVKETAETKEEEALLVFVLKDLFPDPFQAYVFSALLVWLAVALVLLRREWKKSSRIVVDVFLQQGPEAVQLVEDRYKDQLNLPEEYSLLA